MHIDELQNLCHQLPGVTEDIKWENNLCFLVREKIFLLLTLDKFPVSGSFKVPDEKYEEISHREGFAPARYLARNRWVTFSDSRLINPDEWRVFIHQSYYLIRSKLPKKIQTEIESLKP